MHVKSSISTTILIGGQITIQFRLQPLTGRTNERGRDSRAVLASMVLSTNTVQEALTGPISYGGPSAHQYPADFHWHYWMRGFARRNLFSAIGQGKVSDELVYKVSTTQEH